jgi:hypothetical protein
MMHRIGPPVNRKKTIRRTFHQQISRFGFKDLRAGGGGGAVDKTWPETFVVNVAASTGRARAAGLRALAAAYLLSLWVRSRNDFHTC